MAVKTKPAGKRVLLLGGGAPNSPLIAGALAAFLDEDITFDIISATGAGVLMGLLYLAPRGCTPREALKRWADIGIADSLYQFFPVNYKVFKRMGMDGSAKHPFFDAGPLAASWLQRLPDAAGDLWSDWTQQITASLSATDHDRAQLGLCAPLPFLEKSVDFAALAEARPEFYIDAYNLSRHEMVSWGKQEITPKHVRAALSFPFLYPPTEIDGDEYIEGAALNAIHIKPLLETRRQKPELRRDIGTMVLLDILGDEKLLQKPRSLYDAWVRSIITPLVKISRSDLRLFELEYNTSTNTQPARCALLKANLTGGIRSEHWPEVLDWSRSNMQRLFDIGYSTCRAFCVEHRQTLKGDHARRKSSSTVS
jgi:predicted acylesterase/phospholipase RssA